MHMCTKKTLKTTWTHVTEQKVGGRDDRFLEKDKDGPYQRNVVFPAASSAADLQTVFHSPLRSALTFFGILPLLKHGATICDDLDGLDAVLFGF